jgi:hypothetical protein
LDLVDELAEIASATTDPMTAARLMTLIARLWKNAGLPSDDDSDDEYPPPRGGSA